MLLQLYVVTVVLSKFTFSAAQDQQRLPENATVLQGDNGTFICDGSSLLDIVWKVENLNSTRCLHSRLAVLDQGTMSSLIAQNIFLSRIQLSTGGGYASIMTITGTVENNETRVACALEGPDLSKLNYSRAAFLSVIGPPTSLVGLQASAEESGVLFSWSPSFSSYSVPITYHTKLQQGLDDEAVLSSTTTNTTSFPYFPPEGFCSVLIFKIHASNLAGQTNEANLTYRMFTGPDVEAICTSVHHEVQLLNGQISSDIEFDPVSGCEAYPVSHYVLLLKETTSKEDFVVLDSSTEPSFTVNSSSIRRNAAYSFKVRAVNILDIFSETEELTFFTTDVQKPVVFINSNSVIVQCTFLPGSMSRGCHVKIDGLSSSTVSFDLERRGNRALHEYVVHGGIGRNVELNVNVFDLKSDGTLGNLSVSAAIADTRAITEALNEDDAFAKWDLVIIVASCGTAVVTIMLLIVMLLCCAMVHRCRAKAHSRPSSAQPGPVKALTDDAHFPQPNYPTLYEVHSPFHTSNGNVSIPEQTDSGSERMDYSQLQRHKPAYCDRQSYEGSVYSQLNRSAYSLPAASRTPLGRAPPGRAPSYTYLQYSEGREYALRDDIRAPSAFSSHSVHSPHSPPDYSEIDTLGRNTPKMHSTLV